MLSSSYGGRVFNDPPPEAIEVARTYLRELYALINSDMTGFLDSLNHEELRHHVLEVLNEALYIYYPCDNERNIIDVISDIEKKVSSNPHAVNSATSTTLVSGSRRPRISKSVSCISCSQEDC